MEIENKSGSVPRSVTTNSVPRPGGQDTEASDLRSKAGDAVSKLADVAQGAAGQAKAAATSLASEANEKAKGVMNEQVAAGAAWVGHLAEATKAAAENLKPNAPQFSGLVRDAATRVEKFSKNLKDQSVEDLYRSAAAFTRRQPAMVFGSAALFGFFISRLLKMEPTRGPGPGEGARNRASRPHRTGPSHDA